MGWISTVVSGCVANEARAVRAINTGVERLGGVTDVGVGSGARACEFFSFGCVLRLFVCRRVALLHYESIIIKRYITEFS